MICLVIKIGVLQSILSSSYYKELISLKDVDKINYYITHAKKHNLNYRQLHEYIKDNFYERVDVKPK